ncbi:MAG: sigma-70 family RNA polymerase sigma factor [Gammaproteobacteria bacterium]
MSGPETAKRLTEWFRQWRMPLRKFLIGHGAVSGADVNDVAQEVFLRLLRYDRAELIEYPQAYLFKMAANVANEWAIRARSRRPHESKWLTGLLAEDSPEHDAARAEACAEIERALSTLTSRQRAVLKLQFGEGVGRAQIAERLGSSERAVKRDLMKSYEKLRTELNTDLLRMLSHGRE